MTGWSQAERYRLLLSVVEAANQELELAGVLEATAQALAPAVPLDALAVVRIEGDRLRRHALHVVGLPRIPGESADDALRRALAALPSPCQIGPPLPLQGSMTEELGRTRRPYVCQDLEHERRFVEDERLYGFGFRSCVRTALVRGERLLGSIFFGRLQHRPFTPEEVELLADVSGPIAGAVANSLAYQEIQELKGRLEEENLALRADLDTEGLFEEIVGNSPALRRVLAAIEKVARTDSTVLVTGETGTGKELVARAIHRRSRRRERALIRVNCAALPEALVASELFGHEKGAFTGAVARRKGRFELADGGTLFLDEVGELPPDMQVALLRVLQEGEFERVGGSETLRTDARLVAATNTDLEEAIAAGKFRSDLFFRLNIFPIQVPALRERREDVPILVEYFAARHGAQVGKTFRRVEKATLDRLLAYDWPGNVRELENVVERAVILGEGDVLRLGDVRLGPGRSAPLRETLQGSERREIEEALRASRGRISGAGGAAIRLGLPPSTLESKLRRLGIDKHRFRTARG